MIKRFLKALSAGWRRILRGRWLPWGMAFLAFGCFLVYCCLPGWIERYGLPRLAVALGVKALRGEVRQLSFSRLDLGEVEILTGNETVLRIPALQVNFDWSPGGTLDIEAVRIVGAALQVRYEQGRWRIPGLYPELMTRFSAAAPAEPEAGSAFRWRVRQIRLEYCTLKLHWDDEAFEIPLNAELRLPGQSEDSWRLRFDLRCMSDQVRGEAVYRPAGRELQVNAAGQLRLSRYRELFGRFGDWTPEGGGSFQCGLVYAPEKLEAICRFPALRLALRDFRLGNAGEAPAELQLSGQPGQLDWALRNWRFSSPYGSLQLPEISGGLAAGETETVLEGRLNAEMLCLERWPLPLESDFAVRLPHDRRALTASAQMRSAEFPELAATLSVSGDLARPAPAWQVRAALKQHTALRHRWRVAGYSGELDIAVSGVEVTGAYQAGDWQAGLSLSVDSPQLAVRQLPGIRRITAGNLCLEGSAAGQGSVPERFGFAGGLTDLRLRPLGVTVGAVNASLSRTVADGEAMTGSVTFDRVGWRNWQSGNWTVALQARPGGFRFDGVATIGQLPGWRLTQRGTFQYAPALQIDAEIDMPSWALPDAGLCRELLPRLPDGQWSGRLALNGRYCWGLGHNEGELSLQLTDGALNLPGPGIAADGVALSLSLPLLPQLISNRPQRLTCRQVKAAGWTFDDILVDFQLESESFFLENLQLKCCDGNVYTHALRFHYRDPRVRAALYCDHLNLARLINQLGVAGAAGDGTLYGRIPFTFDSGGLQVEPGFLYSEPGIASHLELDGLEPLLAGLPEGTAEYTQLDLAAEALKKFDYQWAKLEFAAVDEDLAVALKLDGKPAGILPFRFDERAGRFVRVNTVGSLFQGIRLDVNSRIPLNKLIKFNQKFQNLTEMMK